MATRPKKSTAKSAVKPAAKKPEKRKVATAKVAKAAVRKEAAPKPAPEPVRVNAVKPEEKLPAAGALDGAVDTLEKSLKAAMPAAVAVNRKLVDIAQTNMNSSFELARDLAGVRTPMEALRLHLNYWQGNAGVFQSQAQELRRLSAELFTTANEPIRAHMRRGSAET
jgi:hypothetical protein